MTLRPSRHIRVRGRRLHALLAAAAMVTAACGGPKAPLAIGSKPVPLDLLLGAKQAVAGAPVPPAAFTLDASGMPNFFFEEGSPPSRQRGASSPPPPAGCVENPLAVPKWEAPMSTHWLGPNNATYTYRANGTVGDQKLPETAKVEVLNAVGDIVTATASWQAAVTLGGATTTTSYRVRNPLILGPDDLAKIAVNAGKRTAEDTTKEHTGETAKEHADGLPVAGDGVSAIPLEGDLEATPAAGLLVQEVEPAAPAAPDPEPYWPVLGGDPFSTTPRLKGVVTFLPKTPEYPRSTVDEHLIQPARGLHNGLYLERIAYPGGATFEPPMPGMLLAKFPMQVGSTFDVAATDGLTTMSYRTKVRPKAVVHACGTAIDTWTVDLTRGRVASVKTNQVVEFEATYQVATQYGGLIVSDVTKVKGSARSGTNLLPIERTLATTTMTEPVFPTISLTPTLPQPPAPPR